MTKKELSRTAHLYIKKGKTKQEVFDLLKPLSEIPDEELGTLIKNIPSLQGRQRYKAAYIALVVLLFITVVAKLLSAIPIIMRHGWTWLPALIVVPGINLYLLWEVVTFRPKSFNHVIVFAFISCFLIWSNIAGGSFDWDAMIDIAVVALLIGVSFYLDLKLCPDYRVEKETYQTSEGEHRFRNVIRFED